VSVSAILVLLGLNLWLLAVGNALVFGLRGWESWSELGRLLGLGYMLGIATLGVVWVWQLTIGIHMTIGTIFVTGILVAAFGVIAGIRRGCRLPPTARRRIGLPRLSLVAGVFAALTGIYLEALFRAGRLAGLYEFDAWLFWVPKAKAIYSFGAFDAQFLRDVPNSSYPPLVPSLEAAAFHFMGAMDVATLHLQFWFFLFGFVAAVIGLLSRNVPGLLLWTPLLLVLVTPHVVGYALQPQADFLLDELFAVAVLLVAVWLVVRADWMLAAATPLLGAAMLTKREGYMFAACLVAAALVASFWDARVTWPKLIVAALIAAAVTVPWHVFVAAHDLGNGASVVGGGILSNPGRAWPSFRLALSTLFDFHIWLVVIPLLVAAIVLAFAGGARRLPAYATCLSVFCLAGLTWSTWAFPSFPFTKEAAVNPIVRVSGGLVLWAATLTPLLLLRARGTRVEVR